MTKRKEPNLWEILFASYHWYGKIDLDYQCLAENRLMKGEKPNG